ncbi:MAG: outer membrane beta-barrel protein [Bacteroidales bacterium]|nr:outer membrane beta-barrel protein [Bacteroidales bacterium]
MKKSLVFLMVLCSTGGAFSQTLEAGVFAGGSYYIGDLNPYYHFYQSQLTLGLVGRYNIDSRWTIRLAVNRGALRADDESTGFMEERMLRFNMNITEVAGIFEFNFLNYYTGSIRNFFSPYIFGGIGLFYGKPKVDQRELRELGTEGQNINFESRERYLFTNFCLPFGMGVKYSFSKRICMTAEWGMRKTFTDYLDDVSTTYFLDPELLEPGDEDYATLVFSDPTLSHKPLQQRGNSKTMDWYAFAGLTLTYQINLVPRGKCSEFQEYK